MDHVLLPKDPILPVPRVPLVCLNADQPYDCGTFLQYPIRAGWPRAAPSKHEHNFATTDQFDPAGDLELEAFLQSWIFFGLLHEVLRPLGLYGHQDYIDHDSHGAFVHTRNLNYKLRGWIAAIQAWEKDAQTEVDGRLTQCLNLANDALECLSIGRLQHRSFNLAVKQSLGAICDAIASALRAAVTGHDGLSVPGFAFLAWDAQMEDRLVSNGWCPSETRFASRNFYAGFPALYFVQNLKLPQIESNHLECSTIHCKSVTIDLRTYTTQHVSDQCRCDSVGPPLSEVANCLEQGSFPVLRVCGSQTNEVSLQVVPFRDNVHYVAISHVWADGLGNPTNMALPRCQLLYFKKTIAKLSMSEASESDPFDETESLLWCDTVCVPVLDAVSPSEGQRQLKTLALAQMRNVYVHAKHVLVLDRRLISFSIDQIGLKEAIIRWSISRWMGRLWTFQEGFLARSLLFQFADRAVDITEMFEMARKWIYASFDEVGFGETIPFALLSFCGPLRSKFPQWSHMLADANLNSVARGIATRAVSFPADEPVCIAGVLNLDLDKIARAPDSERMKEIWQMIAHMQGGIPQRIIFNESPRLSHSGFRWAPSTLMTNTNADLYRDTVPRGALGPKGTIDPNGLRIKYPAWLLRPGTCLTGIVEDMLRVTNWAFDSLGQQIRLSPTLWFRLQDKCAFEVDTWKDLASSKEKKILILEDTGPAEDVSRLENAVIKQTLLAIQTSEDLSSQKVRSMRTQLITQYSESEAVLWETCYALAARIRESYKTRIQSFEASSTQQSTPDTNRLLTKAIGEMIRKTVYAHAETPDLRKAIELATGQQIYWGKFTFADRVLRFFIGKYWEVEKQFGEETEWVVD